MLVKVYSAAIQALSALMVTIEVNASRGMNFSIVGLPDNAVKESRNRILTAIANSSMRMPVNNTVINMAPADLRKEGTHYDLPIAIGMLAATKTVQIEGLERYMIVGELGLDGTVRPVHGALSMAILARSLKMDGMIVPIENAREASVVNNLNVYGVNNLIEVVGFLNKKLTLTPTVTNTRADFAARQSTFEFDFADVKGQESVKRAFEVAAAGGHNLIMVGSPGSGKTMMAQRLPSILPPLTLSESLETTQLYSVASKLKCNDTLIATRPFRSPHHTISQTALCGGGSNPQPGEVSLAHNGVLFCDELPEFTRSSLEVLRQPLEDRVITISRARYSVEYPCSFMFIASMNPCPCGFYNDPSRDCTCTPGEIQRYMGKVSGPLLDRIDIQIEIEPVKYEEISSNTPAENSASIRERVIAAREIQTARFAPYKGIHCNALMNSQLIKQFAIPDLQGQKLLKNAMEKRGLSARAYDRILKVARTIADLDASQNIQPKHIAEAIGYRSLDRSTWGR